MGRKHIGLLRLRNGLHKWKIKAKVKRPRVVSNFEMAEFKVTHMGSFRRCQKFVTGASSSVKRMTMILSQVFEISIAEKTVVLPECRSIISAPRHLSAERTHWSLLECLLLERYIENGGR